VKKDEEKSGKENKRGRPQTDPMSQKSTKNQTTYICVWSTANFHRL